MVPVIPFSVLFMAIVEAQAPECYSLSRIYLCGREPPVPEFSIKHLYPPDMELNADIVGIGPKEVPVVAKPAGMVSRTRRTPSGDTYFVAGPLFV